MKKKDSFNRLIQIILSGIGLGVQVLIFAYFYFNFYFLEIMKIMPYEEKGHALMLAVYSALLIAFSTMYGGTRIGYFRNSELVFSQIMGTVAANAITYAQICLMCRGLIGVKHYLLMVFLQCLVAFAWTIVAGITYHVIFPPRDLLLVHGDRPIETIVRKLESRPDKYMVKATISIREGFENVCARIGECGFAVVIWDIPADIRNDLLKFCYGQDVRVYIMPKISDVILSGAEMLHLFDTPIFLTREYSLKMEERFFKRFIDLFFSILLIIVTSPIMLITAVMIKCYDRGPVIYSQVRLTRGGREFKIHKFRSMKVNAESDGVARLAKENDDRITPIGRFIRKVRIDELPQLFNILAGEMSFIGPRPERPEIAEQYMKDMPEFAYRLKVKAGLAGYAQVYGKYNTTPYDKLKLDICYIENYSVWLDIKLMLLTLKVLFTPDATEGVGEDQVTALSDTKSEERDGQTL